MSFPETGSSSFTQHIEVSSDTTHAYIKNILEIQFWLNFKVKITLKPYVKSYLGKLARNNH